MNRPAEQDPVYLMMRQLTLPLVAVTTSAGGRTNGMIANSAQRASLLPSAPRVSLYVLKTNFSHELLTASGFFGLHLLRADQWELVSRLGLASGRDGDKLDGLDVRLGRTGCPLLPDCAAAFECRVAASLDAGHLTFFLADVQEVHDGGGGALMTSEHFRTNSPEALRAAYEARLIEVQRRLEAGDWEPPGPAGRSTGAGP